MKKKHLTAAALILTAAFALTACGSSGTSSAASVQAQTAGEAQTAETSTEETLAADQTLNIILPSNVSSLDGPAIGWVNERQIFNEVQEGLFRLGVENDATSYEPAGAESYEVSDDGLTYTFHLRENHWSDGEAVTAQQYVDNYVRALTAENGLSSGNYNFIKNGEAYFNGEASAEDLGLKAIDDSTLEITLEYADSNALDELAVSAFPIRLDIVEKATSTYGSDASEMVYSGPFTIQEWTADNKIVLKKNPQYWDADNVKLETVNLTYVAETGTQATLFDSGQLDIVEYNDDYADTWIQQADAGQITYIEQPRQQTRSLIFNVNGKSGLMTNRNVRLALSLAVDRQEYVDTIFGRYYPAWDFTPYTVKIGDLDFNSQDDGTIKQLQAEYDTPEKLQDLLKQGLDEAGYSYNTLSDVTINFTDKAANTLDQARIEYLSQTWQNKLGINIETVVTSDFSYMSGDYDVTNFTWNASSPRGALDLWNADNNGNTTLSGGQGGPVDPDLQALYDSTKGVTDTQQLHDIYKQIEDTIVGDAYTAPIYWGDTRFFQKNYVKGIVYLLQNSNYDFSRAYIVEH